MIVVADSGSTKTDWRFVSDTGSVHKVKTIGFNPYFHDTEFIRETLEKDFKAVPKESISQVHTVYYYGAGCSSKDKNLIVKNALKDIFKDCEILVEHDLIGACRAIFGSEAGIACILGTGANSCVWDGDRVIDNIPSHGYIFGDEGSGSYLGKELLKLYLNDEMDSHMKTTFDEMFQITEHEILEATYKKNDPNVFLASFARFYSIFPESKVLSNIVRFGFNDFFHRRVLKYNDCHFYDLGFVGSIAYNFEDDLMAIAKMHSFKIKSISKCPIDDLVEFHSSKLRAVS